jgi:hypothetical protein
MEIDKKADVKEKIIDDVFFAHRFSGAPGLPLAVKFVNPALNRPKLV